jgi:DNA-binding phage protein
MTEHKAAQAARRVRELEAQLAGARQELIQAVADEEARGIRITRIAQDTGLSRYTIHKYLKLARESGGDQGKGRDFAMCGP